LSKRNSFSGRNRDSQKVKPRNLANLGLPKSVTCRRIRRVSKSRSVGEKAGHRGGVTACPHEKIWYRSVGMGEPGKSLLYHSSRAMVWGGKERTKQLQVRAP